MTRRKKVMIDREVPLEGRPGFTIGASHSIRTDEAHVFVAGPREDDLAASAVLKEGKAGSLGEFGQVWHKPSRERRV